MCYKINIPRTYKFASLIMKYNNNDNIIKRLIYRSKNRGCKENDLILGNFSANGLLQLNLDQLKIYELFIEESDNDIFLWLTNKNHAPLKYKDIIDIITEKKIENDRGN